MKARMGATHFLTKTLLKVAAETALVMNIIGTKRLVAAITAREVLRRLRHLALRTAPS
jgi:hypothetical protein